MRKPEVNHEYSPAVVTEVRKPYEEQPSPLPRGTERLLNMLILLDLVLNEKSVPKVTQFD